MSFWMGHRSCSVTGQLLRRRRRVAAIAIVLNRCTSKTGPSDANTSEVREDRPSSAKDGKKHSEVQAATHQVAHRAQETLGIKVAASVVERVAEVAERGVGKAAVSKTATVAERAAVKALAKQAATRTAERAGRVGVARSVLRHFPAREAAARLGRGLLIAVPVVGAVFAAWIGKSDLQRTLRELELARAALSLEQRNPNARRHPTPDSPTPYTTTVKCFGVATVADSANVITHLAVAYGLYQGWEHHTLLTLEHSSLAAAIVSTAAAVGGELSSARQKSLLDGEKDKHDGEKQQDGDAGHSTPPR